MVCAWVGGRGEAVLQLRNVVSGPVPGPLDMGRGCDLTLQLTRKRASGHTSSLACGERGGKTRRNCMPQVSNSGFMLTLLFGRGTLKICRAIGKNRNVSKILTILICCLLLALAMPGCGKKKAQPRPGAAGQAEEIADSTRLDSAVTTDSSEPPLQDSIAPRTRRGYR